MCEERERLIGYVYDECDHEERRVIEDHLASCSTCREEIAGLRSVRQDLLAWDVPEHESVWRPVAPAPVPSPWKAIPAWAMAAAASAILVAGASGGAVTYALLGDESPRARAVGEDRAPDRVAPVASPVRLDAADMAQLEQRMLAKLRHEMNQGAEMVATHATQPDVSRVAARTDDLARQIDIMSSRQDEFARTLLGVYNETQGIRTRQAGLQQDSEMLATYVRGTTSPTGFGPGR
jgi:Putative zinc-finger